MFYGMALYEMTGIQVKKLIIIMACENGECAVYEERDLEKYMKLVVKYIKKFVADKLLTVASWCARMVPVRKKTECLQRWLN